MYEEESRIFHCFDANRVMSGFFGEVDGFVCYRHAVHAATVIGFAV